MHWLSEQLKRFLFTTLLVFLIASCAHRGNIGGGPKDETPPVLEKSSPLPNQLNFKGDKIVMSFDENILLEDVSNKLVVSPPMQQLPIAKAYGKKLYVDFDEELQENTTYTFDFGDAIVDNNEKNPLGDFALAFSTGEYIDSLKISGYLLYADNLDPAVGLTLGIYKNLDDSAFTSLVPLRIGKTDDKGYFSIKNVAPGEYKIYALKDANNDYKFDQKAEYISFSSTIISPGIEHVELPDTTWIDSVTIDTIIMVPTDVYTPYDLLFTCFLEQDNRQILKNKERKLRERLDFTFRRPQEKLPEIELIDNPNPGASWYVLEANSTKDTLYYWLTDTSVYLSDTLRVSLNYYKTDSNDMLTQTTDTIRMNFRDPNKHIRIKKKDQDLPPPTVFLNLNFEPNKDVHTFSRLFLTTDKPVERLNEHQFNLVKTIDSLQEAVPFEIKKINLRKYCLEAKLEYGSNYLFTIDSASCFDLYGNHNDHAEWKFNVREKESYSQIAFNITHITQHPLQVQLLSKSDEVVKTAPCKDGRALFEFLDPGTYYVRAFHDENGNGLWDTGEYASKRQPEAVFYLNKSISVKANWDAEEDWDMSATHLLEQKPDDLKNKIKRDDKE